MKTNQIVTRKMGDFSVFQRTEDGMFDATALMRQWNSVEGNSKKEMKRFLEADSTKRFSQSLVREEKSKSQKCDFDENQGVKIIKEVKGRHENVLPQKVH